MDGIRGNRKAKRYMERCGEESSSVTLNEDNADDWKKQKLRVLSWIKGQQHLFRTRILIDFNSHPIQ